MTKTALNLRISKKRAESAKKMAQASGTSVSHLVEVFLESMERMNEPVGKEDLHPLIQKIAGSIRNQDEQLRDVVMTELEGKYGR